jgi:hypothetical protein
MERHSLLLELRLDGGDPSWPRSATVKWMFAPAPDSRCGIAWREKGTDVP